LCTLQIGVTIIARIKPRFVSFFIIISNQIIFLEHKNLGII
jgi:hypothetical protein